MAVKDLPSQKLLRQLLRYDPDTGKLFWRERGPEQMSQQGRNGPEHRSAMFNRNFANREAFIYQNAKGYRVGSVMGRLYLAHRIIWKMCFGSDPMDQIDHVNGNTSDNRLCNIRAATAEQNSGNRRKCRTAKHSRYRGVCVAKNTGLFTASISLDGKQTHLGSFRCETAAAIAYDMAAAKKYGEFARLNVTERRQPC